MPGDKSISHRALMLGAIAEGTTTVRGFLASEDCLATQAALEAMGVAIERHDGRARPHRRCRAARPARAEDDARPRQLGHCDSALDGAARGPIVRQRADGRRLAAAAADGARRSAAAADGRADRDLGRRAAARRGRRRSAAARHRLRVADGERAGEVGAVAGGALRERYDDGPLAGAEPRSHGAHAREHGRAARPRVRRRGAHGLAGRSRGAARRRGARAGGFQLGGVFHRWPAASRRATA